MDKKFLVTACAALFPLYASAQSSVSISGVLDNGIEAVNHATPGNKSDYSMVSGALFGSRLSFRGIEDLGGGLKAVFVLESGFNADNGSSGQGGLLFGRSSYVGLENQYGRIALGRQYTTLYDWSLYYDPLGPGRYSSPLIDAAYAGRADNAVKYTGKFGGIDIGAYFGNGSEIVGSAQVGRQSGFLVNYTCAPFSIGVSYDSENGTTVATGSDITKRTSLGVSYDLSFMKLYAGYTHRQNEVAPVASTIGQYWVAVGVPIGAVTTLTAAYYATSIPNAYDPKALSAILTYNLSKRTRLYAMAARSINNSTTNLGVTGFGTTVAGADQSAVTLGIEHNF
jgi:predicted porin